MEKIYTFAERIVKNTNINPGKMFIAINMICCFLVMAAIAAVLVSFKATSATTGLMIVGYFVVILGFFGSAIYVYRK